MQIKEEETQGMKEIKTNKNEKKVHFLMWREKIWKEVRDEEVGVKK